MFTDTDSLMYELKQMFMKILVRIEKFLVLVIIQLSLQITMIQTNKFLVRWKIK